MTDEGAVVNPLDAWGVVQDMANDYGLHVFANIEGISLEVATLQVARHMAEVAATHEDREVAERALILADGLAEQACSAEGSDMTVEDFWRIFGETHPVEHFVIFTRPLDELDVTAEVDDDKLRDTRYQDVIMARVKAIADGEFTAEQAANDDLLDRAVINHQAGNEAHRALMSDGLVTGTPTPFGTMPGRRRDWVKYPNETTADVTARSRR